MDVESEIQARIRERDRITFAEFMDLALFSPPPVGGYYLSPGNVGPTGDFYTAPSAHPSFGALLCVQVFQMWSLLDCPPTFWLVEMGAGGGLLCRDLLAYSAHLAPEFADSLRYLCLDPLPSRGVESQLPGELRGKVERLAARGVPLGGTWGCFLSNELVDSFPVHRVQVQGGVLKEIYVTMREGKLAEVLDVPSTSALEERLDCLELSLPEGFTAEINLAMGPWMEEVSSALERGFLLTVDYGHPAAELYSQRRRRGTLTCFFRHTQTDDPYQRIGKQDMTVQVDFSSLIKAGRCCGLELLGLNTQRQFLQNLGMGEFMRRLLGMGLEQPEAQANRMAMLDIIRPGGMGDFKVLAQGKGVGVPTMWGFEPSTELESTLKGLPVPLLTRDHTPLLEGRYPHLAFGGKTWFQDD